MLINTSDNFINNNYRLKNFNLRLWEMTDCWKWKISITSSNKQKLVSTLTQHASDLRQHLKWAIFYLNTIFFKCHSLLALTEIAHSFNCLSTARILQFVHYRTIRNRIVRLVPLRAIFLMGWAYLIIFSLKSYWAIFSCFHFLSLSIFNFNNYLFKK